VVIRDKDAVEHKSAERFYWYKMAQHFEDTEAMQKIQKAANVQAAEEAVKQIKNYDEVEWAKVKLAVWEEGQRLKLDQVRWIANLLVLTKSTYLAVATEDKASYNSIQTTLCTFFLIFLNFLVFWHRLAQES
jgi:predicted NAD-dependent protein-ADP-ribosyltransferase YbiA (DUF1768 family)